jgi:N-acetylglucosaminyldiphosphoundecaprenol N-acetyl-beta-D-mannosaminyltransferase
MQVNLLEKMEVGQPAVQIEAGYEDDLGRQVFGVLGLPIDVVDLEGLRVKINEAVSTRRPFWLSTPNVNFLLMSQSDRDFRESLLMSDLCPVDGVPLVWIARLLGVPLQGTLSGSDIFEQLQTRPAARKLKVFLFGGAEGVAAAVGKKLNQTSAGVTCVGALNPGFGSVEELSSAPIVERVNVSQADLLSVFLSARKAQYWLLKNHGRLNVPVRAQFGATINLQAGTLKRAPALIRRIGLEWLWRIKEEPYLWRRYLSDGVGLCVLLLIKVLPLALGALVSRPSKNQLEIFQSEGPHSVLLKLSGPAIISHIELATRSARDALAARKSILIDLSRVSDIDTRFFGLLLVLRKSVALQDCSLRFVNPSPRIRKQFRRHAFDFLLEA